MVRAAARPLVDDPADPDHPNHVFTRDEAINELTFNDVVAQNKADILEDLNGLVCYLRGEGEENDQQKAAMIQALATVFNIVTGSRNKCYGAPKDNHGCTGELWTSYLKRCGLLKEDRERDVDGRDVCDMMVLLKVSRDAHWRQDDNMLDSIGYGANGLACTVE